VSKETIANLKGFVFGRGRGTAKPTPLTQGERLTCCISALGYRYNNSGIAPMGNVKLIMPGR
jgi:hypothetical protein